MIKNALSVYHWFVRQAITGARLVARNPREGHGQRLSPKELGLLAKQLASSRDFTEASRLRERLTRGFYGI